VFVQGITVDQNEEPLNPAIGEKNLAKSLGLFPWILAFLFLITGITLIVMIFRKKSYDARRFFHAMSKALFYNSFIRYVLEIFFRLSHQTFAVAILFGVSRSAPIFSIHTAFAVICGVIAIGIPIFI